MTAAAPAGGEAAPRRVPGRDRLIAALDLPDAEAALALAARLAPHCGTLKLGLELFCAAGPGTVRRLAALTPVFLDLKLHDIPNTVAGAVRALAPLRPALLTVHAGGGAAMVAAAREAAEAAGAARPRILAVTVLTSLDDAALRETGVADDAAGQVRRLAAMALAAGADGLVCSAREAALLRDAHGPGPLLVVPGIRSEGVPAGDQARTATPRAAVAAGADRIVVGRPITGAPDPAAAAAGIAAALDA